MKNIGTKSVNMSDIIVYLAMFRRPKTKDPPHFELCQTETWDFVNDMKEGFKWNEFSLNFPWIGARFVTL